MQDFPIEPAGRRLPPRRTGRRRGRLGVPRHVVGLCSAAAGTRCSRRSPPASTTRAATSSSTAPQIGGRVTLVSEGRIKIAGSRPAFEPYRDGLLAARGRHRQQGDRHLHLVVEVPRRALRRLGPDQHLRRRQPLLLRHPRATPSPSPAPTSRVRGADCGRPGRTVSGPVVVPDLAASLDRRPRAARSRPTPSGYDVTVTNRGTTRRRPLAHRPRERRHRHRHASPATTSPSSARTPPPASGCPWPRSGDPAMTVNLRANPFDGRHRTRRRRGGRHHRRPGRLGHLGRCRPCSPLDPGAGHRAARRRPAPRGVRTRVDFTLDPSSVQARRLYTYGTDFAAALRALGADATGVARDHDPARTARRRSSRPRRHRPRRTSSTPGASVDASTATGRPGPGAAGRDRDRRRLPQPARRASTAPSSTARRTPRRQGGVGRLVAPLQRVEHHPRAARRRASRPSASDAIPAGQQRRLRPSSWPTSARSTPRPSRWRPPPTPLRSPSPVRPPGSPPVSSRPRGRRTPPPPAPRAPWCCAAPPPGRTRAATPTGCPAPSCRWSASSPPTLAASLVDALVGDVGKATAPSPRATPCATPSPSATAAASPSPA